MGGPRALGRVPDYYERMYGAKTDGLNVRDEDLEPD